MWGPPQDVPPKCSPESRLRARWQYLLRAQKCCPEAFGSRGSEPGARSVLREAFRPGMQSQGSVRGSRRHNLLFGRNLFPVPVVGAVIATQAVLLGIEVVQNRPDHAYPILREKIA